MEPHPEEGHSPVSKDEAVTPGAIPLPHIDTTVLGRTAHLPAPIRRTMSDFMPQHITEVSKLAFDDPKVIRLWYGESDLATPAFIRHAAAEALESGETRYTPTRGIPPLRQALADYLTGLYGVPVGIDRVTVTTSGMNAIMLAMQLALDAGDNAVMVTPLWPNGPAAAEMMGAEVRSVSLDLHQGGWHLDMERLLAAVDAKTRLVFVNSPNNPTGWVMTRDEQRILLDFCRERGIWLVADEVYGRLVYEGSHAPSFLEIAGPDDPLIVVNSFSKAWAMTGWRVGWLVTPASIGDLIGEMIQYNVSCVTAFLQPACIAALREGEGFVAEMVAHCRRGRDIVCAHLARHPRVRFAVPEGAFYAFFAIEGMGASLPFAQRLVGETGVGLAPGSSFGASGEGCLRLCYARQPEALEEAMRRLERVLE